MADRHESNGFDEVIDRRQVLALVGASGAAALAGCGGSDTTTESETEQQLTEIETLEGGQTDTTTEETTTQETTTQETTESEPVQVHDAAYVAAYQGNPSEEHFNNAEQSNYTWQAGRCVFAPFMKYSFSSEEFLMGALEDVEINAEAQETILTFRDDLTWDNGDDVTMEDMDVKFQLAEKRETPFSRFIDDWEIVDENTIRLNLSGPTNPRIIKFSLTSLRVDRKKEVHERFLDQEIAQFLEWKWNGEDTPVRSNAMWSFEEKDSQRFVFSRNDQFYKANNVNFDRFEIQGLSSNQARQQALINPREIDGTFALFVPPNVYEQFPDKVEEILTPSKWGYGIVFNHDDTHFGQRAVRQATAFVIDRETMTNNAGPRTKFYPEIPCGIAPHDQETWLGDWMDDFETYGPSSQKTDQAAQVLSDAGYSRDGGTWKNENGNAISGTYYTPAGWSDWTTMTQSVTSWLKNFGFDLSIGTRPIGDWFTTYSDSDFAIGSFYWMPGQARSAFPYYPLEHQLNAAAIGGGHNYRERARSAQTVPARGGGEMTITPLEEVEAIARQPDKAATQPYVQRAAWHNHIDLPFLGLESSWSQTFTTTDEWTVAEEGNSNRRVNRAQHWQVHEGDLQYRG